MQPDVIRPSQVERAGGTTLPAVRAALWLTALAALGAWLARTYPGSFEWDPGAHYLIAHWAWRPGHHAMLVDVWGRPLFTVVYLLPAQFGFPAAKLFTVAICVATAWQTWRLAQQLGFGRAELAIPLLALQPIFLLVVPEPLTEPLFALVLVIALRLHVAGRVHAGMLVASALPLARPEGFFVALLWGVWVLLDQRDVRPWWQRLPATLLLATGMVAWWLAALLITHDPLFIRHNWPGNWGATGAAYGTGSFWTYWRFRGEILGAVFEVPFLIGLGALLVRRRTAELTSLILMVFLLHSGMRAYGLFGDAGYPRYFVTVAPALALVTLAGWNVLADAVTLLLEHVPGRRWARPVVAIGTAVALGVAAVKALRYVDSLPWSRDAWAIDDSFAWFRAHPLPVRQLVWTQEYVAALFDWDPPRVLPLWAGDKAHNMEVLRAAPAGTLLFWDGEIGPMWYGLRPPDFEAAGFRRLRSASYVLESRLPKWLHGEGVAPPRRQEIHLFYR